MKKICKNCGKEFNAKKSRLVCCCSECGNEYKKSEEYKEKIKTSWRNKTAEELAEIQRKRQQTCLKNTGKRFMFQTEEVKAKIKKTSLERYGVENPGGSIQALAKAAETRSKNPIKQSKMELKWLTSLNITIEFQKPIQVDLKHIYLVDGYDKTTNTIYEFLGDFWHGNPNPESNKGRTFTENSQNFIRTKQRLFMFKARGYNIKYIWENDFLHNRYLEGRIFEDKLEY